MTWIEVHQSLRDHRKILALADELDMPEVHVSGHCLYLWLWSLDNAPDGLLPNSYRIIARAAAWTGDPDLFVDALVKVGLLDQHADGSIYIHDWDEYAGKLIDRRKADAEKHRAWRDRKKSEVIDTSQSRPDDVTVMSPSRPGATVPYPTVPNSTVSNKATIPSKNLNSANAAKPRNAASTTTPSLDAILARVPSSTKEKFTREEMQKQFERALAWASEESSRFVSAKMFADWLEREVVQGHVIPDNLSEVEKIQRILQKKPNEKGLIDGQTYVVWEGRLREAKRLEEARDYEKRCRERDALDALYAGDETSLVPEQQGNHKTPS